MESLLRERKTPDNLFNNLYFQPLLHRIGGLPTQKRYTHKTKPANIRTGVITFPSVDEALEEVKKKMKCKLYAKEQTFSFGQVLIKGYDIYSLARKIKRNTVLRGGWRGMQLE